MPFKKVPPQLVDIQGGGDSLPEKTGNAGRFLRVTADEQDAEWFQIETEWPESSVVYVGDSAYLLWKSAAGIPAWKCEMAGTVLKVRQDLQLNFSDTIQHNKPAETNIPLPALAAGTDYAIYIHKDGRLLVSDNFTAPDGENPADVRQVGGFHVFLTGEIAPYSLWDLRFRPACPDPRGMVFEPNYRTWSDIYFLGVDHHINGTSKAGVAIASGSRLPKIPAMFGGNGTSTYTQISWFTVRNILLSHGKRLPTIPEFFAHAFGATPLIAVGSDPVNTGHTAGYRSNCGMEQAVGNVWIWGAQLRGGGDIEWNDIGTGQGAWHGIGVAAMLGAPWDRPEYAGPDTVGWSITPSHTSPRLAARGFSDHKVF